MGDGTGAAPPPARPAGARARAWVLGVAVALGCAGTGAPAAAAAAIVDIAWDAGGAFRHRADLAAGQVLEVCGRLEAGSQVAWRYRASVPMAFNIHYHVGRDVVYPVRVASARGRSDRLRVAQAQDYCWMWTNGSRGAATVELTLAR